MLQFFSQGMYDLILNLKKETIFTGKSSSSSLEHAEHSRLGGWEVKQEVMAPSRAEHTWDSVGPVAKGGCGKRKDSELCRNDMYASLFHKRHSDNP